MLPDRPSTKIWNETIVGREIRINIAELISDLPKDAKHELIDVLSCDEEIIQGVVDQLIFGCTDKGSYGYQGCDALYPDTALDRASRQIAENADGVAKRELDKVLQQAKHDRKYHERTDRWAWKMYHAWPDEYTSRRPRLQDEEASDAD